jgi:hypothetical protein
MDAAAPTRCTPRRGAGCGLAGAVRAGHPGTPEPGRMSRSTPRPAGPHTRIRSRRMLWSSTSSRMRTRGFASRRASGSVFAHRGSSGTRGTRASSPPPRTTRRATALARPARPGAPRRPAHARSPGQRAPHRPPGSRAPAIVRGAPTAPRSALTVHGTRSPVCSRSTHRLQAMQGRYLRPASARFGQSGSTCRARARLTKSARLSSAACGVLTRPATPTEDLGRGRERRMARALPAAIPRLHHPLSCLVVARRHVDEVEQVQAAERTGSRVRPASRPPGVPSSADTRMPTTRSGAARRTASSTRSGTASAARTHRSAGWSPATGTGGSDSRGRRRNTR